MKPDTGEEKSNANADEDPSWLIRPEVRQGSFPGDERIRFVRPAHPAFRRPGYGVLEATEVTEAPHGVLGRIKRLLIGAPIPSVRAEYERLTKFKVLAGPIVNYRVLRYAAGKTSPGMSSAPCCGCFSRSCTTVAMISTV